MSAPATAVPTLPLQIRFDDAVPVLQIPDHLPFEALRAWLREQLPGEQARVGGRAIRLDLGHREIQLFDLRRLVHLLREEFSIDVTGVYLEPDAVHRYTERELKLKVFLTDPAFEAEDTTEALPGDTPLHADEDAPEIDAPPAPPRVTLPNDLDPSEENPPALPSVFPAEADPGTRAKAVRRTLRSGTAIQFDGDLYIFGDVNPGAQVVASGNVVVLGALQGMAHAGAAGDETAMILALDFRPTQLRIGRKIALLPETLSERGLSPQVAHVRDGAIAIQDYTGRLPG